MLPYLSLNKTGNSIFLYY